MKRLLTAMAMLGFAATAAHAQMPAFEPVDSNGDGLVSMGEAASAGLPWSEDQFAAADSDGDGGLNADEYAAAG